MRILRILDQEAWLYNYTFFKEFKNSTYYDLMLETYKNLNIDILFKSHIHGQGHIERVIFFAMILSWKYQLTRKDTDILRYAASLHDTRRIDDSYDTEHGHRAAMESSKYAYGLESKDLEILKAVMTAHSREDKEMEKSINEFDIENIDRAIKLSKLFKDADGLDRVRLGDLDSKFLRNDFSLELVDFAKKLFAAYQ
ncbi:MAG: hypothetical protein PUG67_00080 [Peptoniphilaceae bacterium]|nr:hypothetical protein [Peptoniphilaceae bacterium]MDY6018104.1 hypothetical protein [Anaerococcus sp.]